MNINVQMLLSSLLLAIVGVFKPNDDVQKNFITLVNRVKKAQEDGLGIYITFATIQT